MKRFMQCLFAAGVLLMAAGFLQLLRRPSSAPPAAPLAPPTLPIPPAPPVMPVPEPEVPAPVKRPRPAKVKRAAKKPPAPKPAPTPPKPVPPPVAPAAPIPAPRQDQFDPKLLSKLSKPVKAPSDVEMPQVVAESGQWRGSQSGITQAAQVVFRNAESWQSFWSKAIAPYSGILKDVPAIDFSTDMAVGVFMGEKPLAGYQVEIVSTELEGEGDERTLMVRYQNIDRFLGIFAPHFQVQPFHLLKIPLFNGKIQFVLVKSKR